MGLIGIEERVRELEGTFEVRPRKPSGTELRASIPVILSIEEAERARAVG
jgi:signal transduction histidine kinase